MSSIKTYIKDNKEVKTVKYNGYNWGEVNDFITGKIGIYPSWLKYYHEWETVLNNAPFIVYDGEYIVKYNDEKISTYSEEEFKNEFKEVK